MLKNCSAWISTKNTKIVSMTDSVSVLDASGYIGCSTRRVRALLAAGRLGGFKQGKNWRVYFPLRLTVGTRGPMPSLSRRRPMQRPQSWRAVSK